MPAIRSNNQDDKCVTKDMHNLATLLAISRNFEALSMTMNEPKFGGVTGEWFGITSRILTLFIHTVKLEYPTDDTRRALFRTKQGKVNVIRGMKRLTLRRTKLL